MEPTVVICEGGSLVVGHAQGGLVQLTLRVPGVPDLAVLCSARVVQELLAALIAERRRAGGYPWV
jgi:hypothetical protein